MLRAAISGTTTKLYRFLHMTPELFKILKVDIFDTTQRRMWAQEPNVTEADLCRAVLKVGQRLNDVRAELGLAEILIFPDVRLQELHKTA
jgi:hypothetical protein